ncbi:hypothetical protein T484DRAFT_1752350 [Baffinella frigidus]|nr:hypothetical protein T484DRAFT_1752350 [Cryptophyta sp. CCMP2293]
MTPTLKRGHQSRQHFGSILWSSKRVLKSSASITNNDSKNSIHRTHGPQRLFSPDGTHSSTGRSTRKSRSKMPWRDIIFTGDAIILQPSWTQSGMNDATSFATGGIVLPPNISDEERVLLDMLAMTETHVEAKLAQTETHFEAKPRSPAKRRVLLDLLDQTETHLQAKPWPPSNATGEANDDAFSTATTPCISRTASLEMDTTPSQSRRSSAAQEI